MTHSNFFSQKFHLIFCLESKRLIRQTRNKFKFNFEYESCIPSISLDNLVFTMVTSLSSCQESFVCMKTQSNFSVEDQV